MNTSRPVSPEDIRDRSFEPSLDQIGQNIETILAFYKREEQEMSDSQRVLEIASRFAGRPLFLGCILAPQIAAYIPHDQRSVTPTADKGMNTFTRSPD